MGRFSNVSVTLHRASVVAVLLCAFTASAQQHVFELDYDLRVDIPITAAALLVWTGSELLKPQLAAQTCRWCERDVNPLDTSVRNGLRWTNTAAGDVSSSVTGFALAPVSAFGLIALAAWHDDSIGRFPIDALLIAEAVAVSSAVNQLVKFSVGRERPFVHVLPQDEKALTASPSDNNTSFYSGHTNLAFSLAVASGTIASLRGYRLAPLVWAVGLTVATATGYLRIAGDRHYFTDVITGAAIGAAFGFFTPWLFHGRKSRLQPAAMNGGSLPGGGFVNATWVW